MSYDSPPPPPPPSYGAPVPGGAAAGTSQKAIWSLVCSIVGLVCCGVLSIVGLVLGILARNDIDAGRASGSRGVATAGIVVGAIGIVWLVVSIILVASGNYYYDFNSN